MTFEKTGTEINKLFPEYSKYIRKKVIFVISLIILSVVLFLTAISVGVVKIPLLAVIQSLLGIKNIPEYHNIIFNIRFPHAMAALIAGGGLAISGTVMQSVLRNPLGSPFTLGISQAGAFGAAVAIMIMGTGVMQSTQVGAISVINPYLTIAFSFAACMISAFIIIAIARLYNTTPNAMILCGVALGSLFSAATMFLQYFADDVQLSAIVFWSFGDVGRAGWKEVIIMACVVIPGALFFFMNRWRFNAIESGDETARSLGVRVEMVRLWGMVIASIITASIVSFLGIIAFVGLIAPHIVRKVIGDDYRFVIIASFFCGVSLLLASDIAARLMLQPHVLPVAVLTSFIGGPAFIYLLINKKV